MKASILTILCICWLLAPSFSKTYITLSEGYWANGSTWQGGIAPGLLLSGDTVIVQQPVIFDNSITLGAGTVLQVDSGGALCGHAKIIVNSGAKLVSRGLVEADTLLIPGGNVLLYIPSQLIISIEAILTQTGASLVSNGSTIEVGPWFTCHLPEFNKFSGIEKTIYEPKYFYISPNPNNGSFRISGSRLVPHSILFVKDLTGRNILTKQIEKDENEVEIVTMPNFCNGIYLFEIISPDSLFASGKFEVRY